MQYAPGRSFKRGGSGTPLNLHLQSASTARKKQMQELRGRLHPVSTAAKEAHARAAGVPPSCEHGRKRSTCKSCGGASICEHGRVRSPCNSCRSCGGGSICEHGRGRVRKPTLGRVRENYSLRAAGGALIAKRMSLAQWRRMTN
jgi:hypothetical protein